MSSAGVSGAGSGAPQPYTCYQCDRTVTITPSPSFDLVCPQCGGGFVEEVEDSNPNPTPNPNPFFGFSSSSSGLPPSLSSGLAGIPLLFSSGSMDFQGPADLAGIFGPEIRGRSAGAAVGDADIFNPFLFLQNYLQTLRAGGANIQFVIENSPSDDDMGQGGGFRLPANLGDYFIGPGLEQLIQQLAENDPNRYGTPPASKSAVEALPNVKISDELLASDYAQCAVCKDMFELGTEGKQMPCKHVYHSDCILPWLEMHNSCPVCRFELPTDDPDYENRTNGTQLLGNAVGATNASSDSTGSGGSAGQEDSPTPRTAERRFRLSFPWPFRFGAPAETSNSGVGTNNNNNGAESNSGGRGNQNFGSETRQEDLD